MTVPRDNAIAVDCWARDFLLEGIRKWASLSLLKLRQSRRAERLDLVILGDSLVINKN